MIYFSVAFEVLLAMAPKLADLFAEMLKSSKFVVGFGASKKSRYGLPFDATTRFFLASLSTTQSLLDYSTLMAHAAWDNLSS